MPERWRWTDRTNATPQEAFDAGAWDAIEDQLSSREMSFDELIAALNIPPWELTVALAHLTVREAISSRVDLSTGRYVRLYRVAQ